MTAPEKVAASAQLVCATGQKDSKSANPLGACGLHHVALIVSDYARSKAFYTQLLGCTVIAEEQRAERQSWKLDLAVPGGGRLELFSFPSPPQRTSRPEACGLRHQAYCVADLDAEIGDSFLSHHGLPLSVDRVRRQVYQNAGSWYYGRILIVRHATRSPDFGP